MSARAILRPWTDHVAATGTTQDAPRMAAKTDAQKPALDRAGIFRQKDANHDGKLTLDESS